MSVAATMATVAVQQHGLFTRSQALERDVSRSALKCAVATGEVIRKLPEVYAVAGARPTWQHELLAAVLDAGPTAAASHRAAGVLLGVARRNAPPLVELSVPRSRYSRSPGAIVHRSLDLTEEHVIRIDGIPCTGPLRTLVDLGAVEPQWVVADCLERGLQSGLVTLRGAEWMLTELAARGRNGVGVFRRVLDDRALTAAAPHEGLLEPRMARVAQRGNLPPLEYQYVVVADDGSFVAQPDFSYPPFKEAFEVDGFEAHGTPAAMARDFEREHRLRSVGWNVTRFTWFHVVRRPLYVVDTIWSVLRAHGVVPRP